MRLIEIYKNDLQGLTAKERLARKRLWHRTVTRFLYMMSITSDPITPYPEPDATGHVRAYAPFFLRRSVDELAEVYRVTKSPGRTIPPRLLDYS